MNNNVFHVVYILVISVLVTLLCLSLNRSCKVEVVKECVTDTTFLERIDTIYLEKQTPIHVKVVDTLYLPIEENNIPLPIEQKYYSKTDSYDAWVSGYEPQLDSIRVYNKVEYKTITNTITKTIEQRNWNFYTYMGFKRLSNEWLPSVGLMAKSPKNLIMGVEFGAINNEMYYGVTCGFKIK